ncbi:TerC family protein [bacterium]|nr:TerC family protein [bacterium]
MLSPAVIHLLGVRTFVTTPLLWIGFSLIVLIVMSLDLGVFHRRAHVVRFREALAWTGVWISLALAFCVGIYYFKGAHPALEFLTGYLIEYSLSMDNIFVFLLIFTYFRVPAQYQHRVLFWGILGALVMRALFIAAGAALLARFHWIIYVFGLFLIYSGVKMGLQKDVEVHPERNPVLRLFRRFMPVSEDFEGGKFFTWRAGRRVATPLFVVLLLVESSDVVFACDSIPAIFAITRDPFIVFTSNVFAILGLRSLYFALAGVMRMFHHLHYGLSAILVFVGVKMLGSEVLHLPPSIALGVVAAILVLSIIASIIWPKPEPPHVEVQHRAREDHDDVTVKVDV